MMSEIPVRRNSTILLFVDGTVNVSNMHRYRASRGLRIAKFYHHVTFASLQRIARLVVDARCDLLPFRTKMGDVLFLICVTF